MPILFSVSEVSVSKRGSRGFSLVELAVTMAILGLLASLQARNLLDDLNARRAQLSVEDSQLVLDAARSYRMSKGVWPGDATCSNALSVLKSTTPPFLVGVGSTNRYNSPLSTSCTSQTFSLDQNAVQDWDGFIVNSLAGTEIVNSGTFQVRSTIGIPGSEPALDGKLSRLAVGNAELNRMRTTLLLGGNDIQEVRNIDAQGNVNSGTLTVQQAASIGGSLTVQQAANIAGNLTVQQAAIIAGGLAVQQSANIAGGLSVQQSASIGGNAFVQGESQFAGRARFNEEVVLQKVVAEGQTGCTHGALARDGNGKPLSCQYGVWKSMGGGDSGVGTGFMTGIAGMYKNRITGGYSCPAGLVANLIGGVQIGGCQPCLSYSCSMP